MKDLIPIERIEQVILLIRGQKVILGDDLARLCGFMDRSQFSTNFRRHLGTIYRPLE